MAAAFKNFDDFYIYFLEEHSKMWTRIFHFAGMLVILLVLFYVLKSGKERFLWYIPLIGYGLPGLSHVLFQRNKPVILSYPLWSLMADFKMFYELFLMKQKFKSAPTEI